MLCDLDLQGFHTFVGFVCNNKLKITREKIKRHFILLTCQAALKPCPTTTCIGDGECVEKQRRMKMEGYNATNWENFRKEAKGRTDIGLRPDNQLKKSACCFRFRETICLQGIIVC